MLLNSVTETGLPWDPDTNVKDIYNILTKNKIWV